MKQLENSSKEKGDRQDLTTPPYDLETLGGELCTVPLQWSGASRMWCTLPAKLLQSCPTLCDPMDGSPPVPLSRGFSRQEYWSGLPFPPPGNLPNPGRGAVTKLRDSYVKPLPLLWQKHACFLRVLHTLLPRATISSTLQMRNLRPGEMAASSGISEVESSAGRS